MGTSSIRPNFIKKAEHRNENVCVNDGFFTILSLFSTQCQHQRFSALQVKRLVYTPPTANFLTRELQSPPKLYLELRKGLDFPVLDPSTLLSARISFFPSQKQFITPSTNAELPRWYFLACRTYSVGDLLDDHVTIDIVTEREGIVLGTCVIALIDYKNEYLVRWFPVRLLNNYSDTKIAPAIEIRLWNIQDPVLFWNTESEHYKRQIGKMLRRNDKALY